MAYFFQMIDEMLKLDIASSGLETDSDAIQALNNTVKRDDGSGGRLKCDVGGMEVELIIDSGSSFNTIGDVLWEEMDRLNNQGELNLLMLDKSKGVKAFAYAATKPLTIAQHFKTKIRPVSIQRPAVEADFIVVQGARNSLLGRETALQLNVLRMGDSVLQVSAESEENYRPFPIAPVGQVSFDIDESIRPSRQYNYRIPDGFRKKAEQRIEKMLQEDIIERVEGSPEWLSGLNVVMKGSDDFRLVLNMKRANQAIRRPFFPIPTIEEIRHKVTGAKYFSKMDLSQAFHHLELDEKSRNMTCFVTLNGTFRYKRLVFGVVSAPEIFQKFMSSVIGGLEGVVCYIDDILVYAESLEEVERLTTAVKDRLKSFNLTINEAKSEYGREKITFLGHEFCAEGINIDEVKTKAIASFRTPKDAAEVRSFLGLANFVAPFIDGFGDLTEPLRRVVRNKRNFVWGRAQKEAFERIKDEISRCTITLGAFDEKKETVVFTDASPVAVAAVLTQSNGNGTHAIVSCASRTLNQTERRYDHTCKEALAIVWALEHFQHYLLGRNFLVRTDSKGAVGLLTKDDAPSTKCIMRRTDGFKNRLEMFRFHFQHVNGVDNIADAPSRLSTQFTDQEEDTCPYEIAAVELDFTHIPFDEHVLTEAEIRKCSDDDQITKEVISSIATDRWTSALASYEAVKNELIESNGLLIRSDRIVVPQDCRLKAIRLAHRGHPGMTGTKKLLRNSMWWPKMDRDVERFVQRCEACVRITVEHNAVPMLRTTMPKEAWERLAMDHFGPIQQWNDRHILVIIDYHSRYMLAEEVKSTDFITTRNVMERVFRIFGLPRTLRADNGPAYRSEFDSYCLAKGIEPEHSVQYVPQQNGMAEAAMKIVNKALMAAKVEKTNYSEMLRDAVLAHNSIPHPVTGMIPEESMFNRKVRRALPLLYSNERMTSREEAREADATNKLVSKRREDLKRGAKPTDIQDGDAVLCKELKKKKLDAPYEEERFTVIGVKNGDITMRNDDGLVRKRGVKDVKRQPDEMTLQRSEVNRSGEPETIESGTEETSNDREAENQTASFPTIRRSNRQKISTNTNDFIYFIESIMMGDSLELTV